MMKKSILNNRRIILFCTTIFILSNMISQEIKMFPEGAFYGYLSCFGPPGIPGAGCYGQSDSVTQIHDTLINNKTYQVSSHGITRYLNKKLYYYNLNHNLDQFNFPDNEYVLYDFGLQVNDTFHLPYPRTFDNKLLVISQNQRLMLNGEFRTELILRNSNWTFRWIEGIGDIYNGLFYMNQIGTYDISSSIVCFSDKNGLIYRRDGFDYPCESIDKYIDLWNGLNEKKNEEIIVFPNPFKNSITFNIDISLTATDASLNLFSTDGLLIKQLPITGRGQFIQTFNLTDLNKGIYFAIIMSNNQNISYLKIIKK